MKQGDVDGLVEQTLRQEAEERDAAVRERSRAAKVGFVMMVLAGVAAAGTFGTFFSVWYRSRVPDAGDTLRIALDEYVAGRFDVSERLAQQVEPDLEEQPEEYRIREFLLGAAGVRKSMAIENPTTMRLGVADAVSHLEWLSETNFPPGRTAEGQRILGLGLRLLGRYAEAIEPLQAAMKENPTLDRELLLPLAEVQLRAGGNNLSGAEQSIQRFLRYPQLASGARDAAHLLQARVHTALGEWTQGRKLLEAISDPGWQDEVDLRLAQLFIAQAQEIVARDKLTAEPDAEIPLVARELLDEAIDVLNQVVYRSDDTNGAAAVYLAATAYRLAGKNAEALSRFASLRQNNKQPAEAIAAGIEEVSLLTEMKQYGDAMLAAKVIVRDIADPRTFDPKWLSLLEFRTRLEATAEALREQGAFAESIELAQTLPPVVDPATALAMQAESQRRWGQFLAREAQQATQPESQTALVQQMRSKFLKAGDTFTEVAQLRFTEPEYIDLIWDAIQSYEQARAFDRSLELLKDYLRYERRTILPRGLIAHGRALLALGRMDEALEPLTVCIEEFPRDSLRYEARLLKAIAQLELGKIEEPQRLLDENLHNSDLSPDSRIFRDSLFVSGESLYRQSLRENLRLSAIVNPAGINPNGKPDTATIEAFNANQEVILKAINRLSEAVHRDQRYENQIRARRAQYLIAECERLAAYWPGRQAADPETIETTRRRMNQMRIAHLNTANLGFAALKAELAGLREAKMKLSVAEQSMLRNCFMGVADSYFEMGKLAEAADAYQKVTQEFMNEPLALEAMLQQSLCYDKLGDREAAKRLYQLAGDVLKRIPTDQDPSFTRTTRYDRANWESLLGWLQQT
ncbi:tetratricopeptide repeat protein [Planctomycetaceae bacterium SH139]